MSKFQVKRDFCVVCQKAVYLTEKLVADELVFHKLCFKCCHCSKTLSLGNYASLEGKYYCKPHFKQLFALKGNYAEGFGGVKPQQAWASGRSTSVSDFSLMQQQPPSPSPSPPATGALSTPDVAAPAPSSPVRGRLVLERSASFRAQQDSSAAPVLERTGSFRAQTDVAAPLERTGSFRAQTDAAAPLERTGISSPAVVAITAEPPANDEKSSESTTPSRSKKKSSRREQIAQLQNELEAARQHKASLESSVAALQQQVEQRQRELAEAQQAHRTELKQHQDALHAKRSDAEALEQHARDLKRVQSDCDAATARCAQLEAQLATERSEHQRALDALRQQLTAEHQRTVEQHVNALRQQLTAEHQRTVEQHVNALRQQLTAEHQRTVEQQRSEHERAVNALRQQLTGEHERAVEALQRQLTGERGELEQRLAEQQRAVEALRGEQQQQLTSEHDKLQQALQRERSEHEQRRAEHDRLQRELADERSAHEQRLAELQRQLASERSEHEQRLAEQQRSVDALQRQLAAAQSDDSSALVEALQQAGEAQRSRLRELEAALRDKQTLVDALQLKIDEFDASFAEQQRTREKTMELLRSEQEQLQQELQATIDAQAADIARQQQHAEQQQRHIADLQQQLRNGEQLQQQVADLQQHAERQQQHIADLQQQLRNGEQLQQQVADLQQHDAEQRQQLNNAEQLHQQIADLQQQLRNAEQQAAAQAEQHAAELQELKHLSGQLEEQGRHLTADHSDVVEQLRSSFAAQKQELLAKIDELEQVVRNSAQSARSDDDDDKQTTIDQLQQLVDQLTDDKQQLIDEKQRLIDEKQRLADKAGERKRRIGELTKQLSEPAESTSQLRDELAQQAQLHQQELADIRQSFSTAQAEQAAELQRLQTQLQHEQSLSSSSSSSSLAGDKKLKSKLVRLKKKFADAKSELEFTLMTQSVVYELAFAAHSWNDSLQMQEAVRLYQAMDVRHLLDNVTAVDGRDNSDAPPPMVQFVDLVYAVLGPVLSSLATSLDPALSFLSFILSFLDLLQLDANVARVSETGLPKLATFSSSSSSSSSSPPTSGGNNPLRYQRWQRGTPLSDWVREQMQSFGQQLVYDFLLPSFFVSVDKFAVDLFGSESARTGELLGGFYTRLIERFRAARLFAPVFRLLVARTYYRLNARLFNTLLESTRADAVTARRGFHLKLALSELLAWSHRQLTADTSCYGAAIDAEARANLAQIEDASTLLITATNPEMFRGHHTIHQEFSSLKFSQILALLQKYQPEPNSRQVISPEVMKIVVALAKTEEDTSTLLPLDIN